MKLEWNTGMQRPPWERKKVKKLEKKKEYSFQWLDFLFMCCTSWCHRVERVRKYLMSFCPLCLCTLYIWQPVGYQTHPASVPRKKGWVSLSAGKEALEMRCRWPESRQGWWGEEDWEMGRVWWIVVRPLSRRSQTNQLCWHLSAQE